jgi:hypothetical protein
MLRSTYRMPPASRNVPEAHRYLLKASDASGIEGVFPAQLAHPHPQVRQDEQCGQLGRVFIGP